MQHKNDAGIIDSVVENSSNMQVVDIGEREE